jgi:hypothetical protein
MFSRAVEMREVRVVAYRLRKLVLMARVMFLTSEATRMTMRETRLIVSYHCVLKMYAYIY